jgi:hypothetical protein
MQCLWGELTVRAIGALADITFMTQVPLHPVGTVNTSKRRGGPATSSECEDLDCWTRFHRDELLGEESGCHSAPGQPLSARRQLPLTPAPTQPATRPTPETSRSRHATPVLRHGPLPTQSQQQGQQQAPQPAQSQPQGQQQAPQPAQSQPQGQQQASQPAQSQQQGQRQRQPPQPAQSQQQGQQQQSEANASAAPSAGMPVGTDRHSQQPPRLTVAPVEHKERSPQVFTVMPW